MGNSKFKFKDLKVYQKALDFVDEVYSVTRSFPKEELYGLSSQYKRAAISIPLNIAEGSGDTEAQFNRYIQMSWNSSKECIVCSTIAKGQGFVTEDSDRSARMKLTELSKMIISLQKYLINPENRR